MQIDRGLIIYYNFDGNADDLMNNNPGTVHEATLDSGICESQSYNFNGQTSYIECGSSQALNSRSSGFSISLWVNPKIPPDNQLSSLVAKWAFDPQKDHFGMWLDKSLRVVFAVSEPRQMEDGTFSHHRLPPDEWHHIVGTWNVNQDMRIYINGKLDAVGKQTGKGINYRSAATMKIGRQVVRRNRPYKGNIDELRIYNRTLASQEVEYLYQEGLTMCEKVFVEGQVLNKKTQEPTPGLVIFEDLDSGKEFYSMKTEGDDCRYRVKLPRNFRFAFYAKADEFISVNENINTLNYPNDKVIKKDLFLVPVLAGESISLNNIFFESAKADLKTESFNELNRILPLFEDYPNLKIEIAGHTDWIGSDKANQALSDRRANSVREYFISQGVDTEKIVAKGYGEKEPVADNETDEGRAMNRRVEFRILEK
ncbi:LamG-like jellyroll fold domain-containing protein [Bacteroidota bacterium]